MSHTPTRWLTSDVRVIAGNGDDTFTGVCVCNTQVHPDHATGNAEHIVRCVNAHDVLVAALTKLAHVGAGCTCAEVRSIALFALSEIKR